MTVGKALRAILAADSNVTGLIGGSEPRIYPNELPQKPTFPCLRYQQISGPRDYDLSGPTGNADARMQVDCLATTYAGVQALKEPVRKALSGYRGTIAGVEIQKCFLDAERDLEEPALRDAEKALRRVTFDFLVSFVEATS